MKRRLTLSGSLVRRIVQAAALLAFFGLVLATRRHGETTPGVWLQGFFLLDPLVLALTWLSAHAVPVALWTALVTVGVTLIFGRVFCGWFCPLGTIHAIAGRVIEFCWPRRQPPEHWSRWQLTKYYLLGAVLLMAACGVHTGAILDPLVLLYRTTVVVLMPGTQWAVEDGSAAVGLSEPVRQIIREHATEVERQAFTGSGLVWLFFVAIVAANRIRPRFWCRYVCPLGAMLGVIALRPLWRRQPPGESCNQCDLCGQGCHGAASQSAGDGWIAAECFGCLNCTEHCRRNSLEFGFQLPIVGQGKAAQLPSPVLTRGAGGEGSASTNVVSVPSQSDNPKPAPKKPNRSRRDFFRGIREGVAVGIGGVAGMFLLRSSPQARGSAGNERLVRPPGALAERDFLSRCTACGLCMRVCPTGCLQPTLGEAGLEGLWTPHVVPRLNRCEYDCTLCGHVCPTGAIAPLTVEEKHAVKIGVAILDHSRCIPYAYGLDCGTCVEACPFPEKAIRLVDVEVQVHDGKKQRTRIVGQPVVDPDRCTGCGGCVKECTFKDEPAIHVISANESRNPAVKPFLDMQSKPAAKPGSKPAAAPGEESPY